DAQRLAACERLIVDEVGGQLSRLRSADDLRDQIRDLLHLLGADLVPAAPAAGGTELGVDAVQHHALERHAQRGHLAREVLRVAQHLLLGTRDEDEPGPRRAQDLVGAVDARLEVLEEPAHVREEVRDLGQRRDAGGLLEAAKQKAGGAVHGAQRRPARREVRAHEPFDDLAVEEVGDPARGLEEVERVARRRGVDHDQVVAAALGQRAELLDRHVLVRAREALREVLVEPVGEDAVARLGRRVPLDEGIPRPLLVEHHRGERALRREALGAEVLGRDVAFPAAERREAERAGEPAGRVDGQHDGTPPFERPPEGQRRGHRRLAEATAAGGDADLMARDEVAERHGRSADTAARPGLAVSSSRDRRSTSPRSNSSTKRKGSSTIGTSRMAARRRVRYAALISDQPLSSAARSHTARTSARSSAPTRLAASRSAARAAGEKRRWWTRFTITEPTGMASGPTSSACVSSVSATGISSARVTRCTAVVRGSRRSSTTFAASRCTRPAPKVSRAACGMRRYCTLWPVAGASTTTASHSGRPRSWRVVSYQILPTVMSSFSPGAAATKYW